MKYSAAMLLATLVIATSCSRDSGAPSGATARRGLRDAMGPQACVLDIDELGRPVPELDEEPLVGRALPVPPAYARAATPAPPMPRRPKEATPTPAPPPAPAPPEQPAVEPENWGPEPVVPRTARAPDLRPPAPLRPVRPAPAAEEEEEPDLFPSTPAAVAAVVGTGGLVLGGLAVGMGDGPPNIPLAVVGVGMGVAGFTTAGILYLIEGSGPKETKKPVVVGVGPARLEVVGGF